MTCGSNRSAGLAARSGSTIDRYYIENFLDGSPRSSPAGCWRSGERICTEAFGHDVTRSADMLHVPRCGGATYVADLSDADVPSDTFDCVIITPDPACHHDMGLS